MESLFLLEFSVFFCVSVFVDRSNMDNTNNELFAQLRKQFKNYRLFKPIYAQRCTKHQDVLTKSGYLSLYPGLYAYKANNKEQSFDVITEEKLTAFYKASNITDGNLNSK